MAAVLVVDSDPFVRHLLRLVLEARGHAVIEAEDDWRALQILDQSCDPLIALLSSRALPLDGMQLLQAVSTDRRLRAAHGFLILTREAGWLPPPFQRLKEILNLRHLLYPKDLVALDDAIGKLASHLPALSTTRPSRKRETDGAGSRSG